ncbi:MAG: VCBS repeat-containing protein [Thermoanaerobaculia bacterium]|nr:VCBS repeat-containing protein [Thermoanaerobaculia bacterium]
MTLALAAMSAVPSFAKERLDRTYQGLNLPGVPVKIMSVDLDGDGRRDLALVVAYSEWTQIAIEEHSEMEGIEGLVEILTIVPSLDDRRELWTFLADTEGAYHPAGPPLELGIDVLAVDVRAPNPDAGGYGMAAFPLVALTDEGVSGIQRSEDGTLQLTPLVEDPPVLAGSGVFLPGLQLVAPLFGDAHLDLVIPTTDGLALYAGNAPGFSTDRLLVPNPGNSEEGRTRLYPLPEIRDVNGDGELDLVWQDPGEGWKKTSVAYNRGDSFSEAVEIPRAGGDEESVVYFGDVDGDGRAEVVTAEELNSDEDMGMREEMREAEAPPHRYRLYRLTSGATLGSTPYATYEAAGHAFAGGDSFELPGGFKDLDGDGRSDFIALTLQLSLTKMVAALATHRISLPMDFHIWCQGEGGQFRKVQGLDLSGQFKLNLEKIEIRTLPMFQGDFDGDGRTDFVQMGRGKKVTIHRGGPDCTFPAKPDLVIGLEKEIPLIEFVRIEDLDADGRSDLIVIQPGRPGDDAATSPVRLDLYLSGGAI